MNIKESDTLDFNKFFNSLRGSFLIINPAFEIVAANEAYLKQADVKIHQVIGKNATKIFPGDIFKNTLQTILRHKEAVDIKFDIQNKSYTTLSCIPIKDEAGEIDFIGIEMIPLPWGSPQEQLYKSQELFANLFEFNPAALAISRIEDSKIINANEAFIQLFDFSTKEEVVGKTSLELNMLIEPQQRNEILQLIEANQKKVDIEANIRTHQGNLKWVSVSVIRVMVENCPCLMAVLLDITSRKEAEDKIKSINTSLEQEVIDRTKEMLQKELEYHAIIEQATDGIFISDERGKYIDVNPSACQLVGYSKDELLTMTVRDVLLPEDLLANPPRFEELQLGKTIISSRNLIRKDGFLVPVEISSKMLSNGRMLGIVRDITERKKYESEILDLNVQLEEKVKKRTAELEKKVIQLKESDEKFQKAFNASSAGITMTRLSDSKFIDVNPAFLKMIGFSRKEVINRSSVDLGLIVNIADREDVLAQVKEKGAMRHMEMTIRKKTGELVEVLSSIETISYNSENYAINIIYDITEQKHAQRKLEEVNRELESFSYSVSHDLRAPLRSILGYTGIIQEDFGNSIPYEVKKQLDKIKSSATRMGQLIDDLLEFSRVGKQEQIKSVVNTNAVVGKSIYDLKTEIETNAEFIVRDLHPSLADLSMISQVWYNLISNAIKYSSKKKNPLIEIGSTTGEGEMIFYIRDNGAGFNMEFSSKLFGVFHRLHGMTEFEGTGVGLALVKRIIERHGGRVWAEGKEREGATFYFSLPA
jgi:PAS domain S-box-containing protein